MYVDIQKKTYLKINRNAMSKTLSQQTLNGRLLWVIIGGAKK